jgi:hypothetical protein
MYPEPPPDGPPEPERLSYAAYFGAATGLVAGICLAMVGADLLHRLQPGSRWAEVFWEVASPILALLGALGLGFGFHRWLRGRVLLPAGLFIGALALGAWLALGPVGFAWRASDAAGHGGSGVDRPPVSP